MFKHKKLEEICFNLNLFATEILKMSAALRAYQNIVGQKNHSNCFLKTSYDAIWREMLAEIAKLFDPSNNGSNENCSLLRLKDECLKDSYVDLFPDGKNDIFIKLIDLACQKYEELPIKKSRNKQLSHHDMKQALKNKPIEISFEDTEKLIFLIKIILETIYEHINFIRLSLPNYDRLVKSNEKSTKLLVNIKSE